LKRIPAQIKDFLIYLTAICDASSVTPRLPSGASDLLVGHRA
jgi:hypothetical protein